MNASTGEAVRLLEDLLARGRVRVFPPNRRTKSVKSSYGSIILPSIAEGSAGKGFRKACSVRIYGSELVQRLLLLPLKN